MLGKLTVVELLRRSIPAVVVIVAVLFGSGKSIHRNLMYWSFLASECHGPDGFLQRAKIVAERPVTNCLGETSKVFVMSTQQGDDRLEYRIITTDDNYRIKASWSANASGEVISVGVLDNNVIPKLEIVRFDKVSDKLVLHHFYLSNGLIHSFNKSDVFTR